MRCSLRADLPSAVGLAVLPFLIFGPALATGRVVSSADNLFDRPPWQFLAPGYRSLDPTMSDISQFLHPYAVFAAREIRAGRFPLWNPYAFGGVPFFAHPHSAVLFPLTALGYVLPLTTALTLAATLKLAAAGIAMYWFLRVLTLARAAALVGVLAFQLSGPMVGWLLWPFSSTMIFLPLLFGLGERLRGAPGASGRDAGYQRGPRPVCGVSPGGVPGRRSRDGVDLDACRRCGRADGAAPSLDGWGDTRRRARRRPDRAVPRVPA